MKEKINKLRNEIVDNIEKIVSISPQKKIVLFKGSNPHTLEDNPPPQFTHIHKHGLAVDYYLQSISFNKAGLLEFNGVDDESGEKIVKESDWINIETLVDILEYIK